MDNTDSTKDFLGDMEKEYHITNPIFFQNKKTWQKMKSPSEKLFSLSWVSLFLRWLCLIALFSPTCKWKSFPSSGCWGSVHCYNPRACSLTLLFGITYLSPERIFHATAKKIKKINITLIYFPSQLMILASRKRKKYKQKSAIWCTDLCLETCNAVLIDLTTISQVIIL